MEIIVFMDRDIITTSSDLNGVGNGPGPENKLEDLLPGITF